MMDAMMKEMMKKKKKEGEMDPQYKSAKMGVLKDIRNMASDEMGEDVKGLKKVTVAAPDAEGLKAGLDKAEDMVSAEAKDKSDESEIMDEVMDEEMKPEEIDAMIAMLEAKKAKLEAK